MPLEAAHNSKSSFSNFPSNASASNYDAVSKGNNKRKSTGNDAAPTAKANRPINEPAGSQHPHDVSEVIALQAQLSATRSRLAELENKLEVERVRHERDRGALADELSGWKMVSSTLQGEQSDVVSELRKQLSDQESATRALERELGERVDREQKQIVALSNAERRAAEVELERDAAVRRCTVLEAEVRRSSDHLEAERSVHRDAARTRTDTLATLCNELETARSENASLRSKIEQLRDQLDTVSSELRVAKASSHSRSSLSNEQRAELQYGAPIGESRGMDDVIARRNRELELRVSELEQSNSALRTRCGVLERIEAEILATRHDAATQREALAKWNSQVALLNDSRLDSPENLFTYLSDLRSENRLLVAERGSALADVNALRTQLAALISEKESAEKKSRTTEDELRKQLDLVQRFERKSRLLRKECDSYLKVIEAYHNDSLQLNASRAQAHASGSSEAASYAHCSSSGSSGSNENVAVAINNVQSIYRVANEQLEAQVRRLESELLTLRSANEALKTDSVTVGKLDPMSSATRSANVSDSTANASSTELTALLRSRIAELERRLSEAVEARERCEQELEGCIAAGWYDAQRTRVLTFETDRLPFYSKTTGLLEHISVRSALIKRDEEQGEISPSLRTSTAGSGDHDVIKCNAEKQNLLNAIKRSRAKQGDLNAAMLREFKSKLEEFKDALYHLFGFRIERFMSDGAGPSSNPQIKLQSVFAEDEHDCLLFEQTAQKQILLIENEYVRKIGDFVRENLLNAADPAEQNLDDRSFYQQTTERQPDLLPIFLARLQIDLRQQQLQRQSGFGNDENLMQSRLAKRS